MADIQANIGIGVDTTQALAAIRQLQREISVFHTLMAKGGANAAAKSLQMQQGLINTINETGKFSASMTRISSSTESFTNALEKNKLSMSQYFRYAGGASKTFGKAFTREFDTINRVATERVKDLQTQYISMGRDANGALKAIKVRPLALDMDNLGTKVMLASQKQQIFNQLLKQGTTNLLNFGKNTQWAGRQLMVGFTIPLTIFGATAAREFQKLEEQAVKFRRVYGDMFTTDADTEKALSNVKALAEEFTKYGIAVEKTVGLAAKVAQMGNVGEDLTAQVTQATRLAVLGGLEQEQALDTTISLTNAFGVAAEDLAGKIAFLNAAENQTILSIEDFNEAIPKAGSVVQQLGGDVEDLAFFLTAMREGGINASQAANALKTSLARLIAPTEVAKKEMAGFGIDIVSIVENNAGNLKNTVLTLGQELDKLDPLNRARAIEQLFGKFQFARMSTMFQNIVRDGSQASKILDLTTNSVEELAIIADRELRAVEESPAFRLQKQMEQLRAALAPIGEEFIKAVGPLIEFGTKLLKSFNNLGDGSKQFIVVLTAIAGVIAPAALMAFGLIANGVANLIKFFTFLGGAFGMLSGKSTLLGGQTEYMTQQQIEAAAVAASLGQSHNNLTQIFTAEATAIQNLVTQYRAAIVEQRKLSVGQTAMGVSRRSPRGTYPKGFAKGGIIRGPGTGTSDSIPAMVSDGEAIIPAKETQKYYGLIQAIIANNVPGYATAKLPEPSANAIQIAQGLSVGTSTADSVAKHVEKEIQKRARHFGITLEQAASDIAEAVAPLKGSVSKVKDLTASAEFSGVRAQRVSEVEQQTQFAHFGGGTSVSTGQAAAMAPNRALLQTMAKIDPQGTLAAKHSWGMDLSRQANREMDVSPEQIAAAAARGETPGRKGSLLVEEMASRTQEQALESFKTGITLGGGDTADPEIQQSAVQFHQKILDLLQEKVSENANAVVVDTDEQLSMMTPGQQANAISMEGLEREAAGSFQGTRFGDIRGAALDRPKELRLRVNEDVMTKAQQALDRADITQEEYDVLSNIRGRGGSKGIELSKTAELPGMKDLENQARLVGADTGQGVIDGYSDKMQISSPSKRMYDLGANAADSLASGFEQGMAEQKGKPPLPGNLQPPKPPVVPETPQSKTGQLFSSFKGKAAAIGNKAMDAVLETGPGKKMANYFAETSGADITNSQGKVVSTLHQEIKELGDASDRAADQVKENTQAVKESGQTSSKGIQSDIARDNDGNPIIGPDGKPLTNKQVRKEASRQSRQRLASRSLAGLGTLTMAAGMATQVPGVVGETAQKLVGPLAALSGILPILISLGPVLGSLVAIVGLVAAGFMIYNKTLKDTAKETYELQRAMGSGRKAIQSFAEFSGKVTQTELYQRQREERFNPFDVAAGKSTFGENFAANEAGQALVGNIRTSLVDLGRDQTVTSVFLQLGQAVGEGALSIPEARSIATELGDQLGDMSFGMEVNANLMRLLGPGGEELLAGDRLTILADLREERQRTRGEMQYEPTTGFEDRTIGSDRNVRRAEIVESLGGGFGGTVAAFFTSGEWHRLSFELNTGIGAAKDNMEQLATILAQGVNDADFYASQMAAVEAQYGDSLKEAYAADDTYEINRLEQERSDELEKILADRKESQESTLAELQKDIPKTRIAMKEALAVDFADDEAALAQYTGALKQIQELGLEEEKSLQLEYMLTSGDMPFQTAMAIVQNYEDMPAVSNKIIDIQTKFGGDFSGDASELFNIFKGIDEALAEKFVISLDTTDINAYQKQIEGFGAVASVQSLFPEGEEVLLNFVLENPEELDDINERLSKLDQYENKELTLDFVTQQFGPDVAYAYGQIWESIPEEDRKTALYSILTSLDLQMTEGFNDIFESLKGQTIAGVKIEKPEDILSVIGSRAATTATGNRSLANEGDGGDTPGGGGSPEAFDPLINKLRDLRLATIDMKRGWDGMMQSLESVFAGGTKAINVFEGLSNQIRRMGVGENLIEMIVGMDPDEYEKRKGELFVFDKAGNIVGTTTKLKNMQAAFNAIAIGEYVNSQQSFIENTKNQISAISILTANGMSLADAYEAVQDEALAAAIAMGATRAEIQEILRITNIAKQQREAMEEQQERSRISESVRKTNEEYRNQVNVLSQLSKAQGKYTDAQIGAIMNDKDLQKLFLNPSIDPRALEEALRNAEQQANLNVQIALQTKAGQIEQFSQLQSEVNDYFAKEEAVININFEVATADDSKIIEDAENQIAEIQYRLDDYNAELEQISWIEDDINEKYDKRAEALDEISKTNERIANQQKAQLDIADALSRGDIAAAARATAELRSQQVQDAEATQKDMLDRQREQELAAVRGPGGMTREQLEEQITQLERQIFTIEENLLEPAQERIRLAEITRDLAMDQLALNEMNRLQFDEIAASTSLAALNMEDMVLSAQKLAALGEFIQTGEKSANWEELFPQPGAAPAPSSGGGGGGAPAPRLTETELVDRADPQERKKYLTVRDLDPEGYKRWLDGLQASVDAQRAAEAAQRAAEESRRREAERVEPVYMAPTATTPGRLIVSPTSPASVVPAGTSTIVNRSKVSNAVLAAEIARDDRMARRAPTPAKKPFNLFDPSTWYAGGMIIPKRMAMGGSVRSYSPPPLQMNVGGRVMGYAAGGFSMGSDIVPAMLTPGEFVVRKRAVQNFGMEKLERINSGTYNDGSVYNYNLAVNVKSDSDPNRIARAVITNIKSIENQRIRGNKL